MQDENEIRLADIQSAVHRIETSQSLFEKRLDRADVRMTEMERAVVEIKAEQRGVEKVMSSEHVRLHEKIDGLHEILLKHTEREDSDRSQQIGLQWSTFLAMAGAIAWWVVEKVSNHG
jgi:hypothetical protein